jgi:PAS domain S-box-containing protein
MKLIIKNLTLQQFFAGLLISFLICNQNIYSDTIIDKIKTLHKTTSDLISTSPNTAISYAYESLKLSREAKSIIHEAISNSLIGECNIKLGNNKEAINYFEAALNLFRHLDDTNGITKMLVNLGNAYRFLGYFERALDLLTESLEMPDVQENYESKILALNNIGIIHRNFGRDSLALKYYTSALDISIKNKFILGEAITLNNIGSYHWFRGDNNKAFYYYSEALQKNKEIDVKNDRIAASLNNLGNVYRTVKNYSKALSYYDSSLQMSKEIGDKNLQTVTLKNIGIIYSNQNNFQLAENFFNQSYLLAIKTGQKRFLIDIYNELSKLNKLQGNLSKALDYQEMYYKTRDSIINEENSNRIADLDVKYREEKKFKELQNRMIEQKDKLTVFIIVLVVLLVVLLIVIFNRYKLEKKTNKEVIVQKEKLEQLNKEINASRTKYYTLFETIGDPVLLIDVKSEKILEANTAATNKYGYSIEEFRKLSTKDLSTQEHNLREIADFETILLQNRIHKKKNGELITVEILTKVLKDDNNFLLVASVRDVTERKKSDDELKRSELLFRSVWESSKDGMRLINKEGKIILVNSAYCKLVDKQQEELIGEFFSSILKAEIQQVSLEREIDKFTQRTILPSFEKEVELWNKKKIWLEFSNSYVEDELGNPKLLSILRDITDRKKTEQELIETNKSKDKLFSIIAHDLKSPFQGLIGFSDLLLDEVDTITKDKLKHYVTNINKITKNLFALVEQLLEWSRLQMGRVEFNPKEYDLNISILNTISLLEPNAFAKEITIEKNFPPEAIIYADQNMITSVLTNLVTNAIKFSYPNCSINITVQTYPNEVVVSVIDRGTGLNEEELSRLFKIDSAFSREGTMKEKGTGLGLLLCKEIMEKHKGKIWAESEVGKGSNFYFSLPYKYQH